MKIEILRSIMALLFIIAAIPAFPQCDILNRVAPDGSMQFFIEPVNFYWTKTKSLKGGIVTDKENYFLELYPVPFPEKPAGNKLKKELLLKLSNDSTYKLKHFDTRYVEKDTVFEMVFLIRNDDIDYLKKYEVEEAFIDMMGKEGLRSYQFRLHKSALKEQLDCFLKEEEDRKK